MKKILTLSMMLAAVTLWSCGRTQTATAQTAADVQTLLAIKDSLASIDRQREEWKRLWLAPQAFEIIQRLPEEGTGYDAYHKACLLDTLLRDCHGTDMPRATIGAREYQLEMLRKSGTTNEAMEKEAERQLSQLRDYIDERLSVSEYRKRHGVNLDFDPVERTARYEEILPEVEEKAAALCRGQRRGFGFCYFYWERKTEVLREYGIEWESPAMMNPEVMFD